MPLLFSNFVAVFNLPAAAAPAGAAAMAAAGAAAGLKPGNTKGGSIVVPLTSCLTGLD